MPYHRENKCTCFDILIALENEHTICLLSDYFKITRHWKTSVPSRQLIMTIGYCRVYMYIVRHKLGKYCNINRHREMLGHVMACLTIMYYLKVYTCIRQIV